MSKSDKLHAKLNELNSLVGNNNYSELLCKKLKFLYEELKFPVPIVILYELDTINEERVKVKGKVVWTKPNNGADFKDPRSIKIDGCNLSGINFLAVLLHECGHVEDADKINIALKTDRSEISAWQNAVSSFLEYEPPTNDQAIFLEVLINSLESYGIKITSFEDLMKKE